MASPKLDRLAISAVLILPAVADLLTGLLGYNEGTLSPGIVLRGAIFLFALLLVLQNGWAGQGVIAALSLLFVVTEVTTLAGGAHPNFLVEASTLLKYLYGPALLAFLAGIGSDRDPRIYAAPIRR